MRSLVGTNDNDGRLSRKGFLYDTTCYTIDTKIRVKAFGKEFGSE